MPAFIRALLVGSCCVLLSGVAQAAEAPAAEPSQPPVATTDTPLSDPVGIEQAIAQIVPPVDQKQVDHLAATIKALEDPAEQQRLQQVLDARLSKVAHWLTPDAPDAVITQRVEALNLGDEPTTADLDARDEVLSTIERIEDPSRRERFVDQLRKRERDAGTLIEAPKSSSP